MTIKFYCEREKVSQEEAAFLAFGRGKQIAVDWGDGDTSLMEPGEFITGFYPNPWQRNALYDRYEAWKASQNADMSAWR